MNDKGGIRLTNKVFETWNTFLMHVEHEIAKGTFQDFIEKAGVKENQLEIIWDKKGFYDIDYLELDDWEGFQQMFPTSKLYEEMERFTCVIELRSCRIPVIGKDIVFYVAGEESLTTFQYVCYAYGFQEKLNQENKSSFQCLINETEQ